MFLRIVFIIIYTYFYIFLIFFWISQSLQNHLYYVLEVLLYPILSIIYFLKIIRLLVKKNLSFLILLFVFWVFNLIFLSLIFLLPIPFLTFQYFLHISRYILFNPCLLVVYLSEVTIHL